MLWKCNLTRRRIGGGRWVKWRRRENYCWRVHSGQGSWDAAAMGAAGWALGWLRQEAEKCQPSAFQRAQGPTCVPARGQGTQAGVEDLNFLALRLWWYSSSEFPLFRILLGCTSSRRVFIIEVLHQDEIILRIEMYEALLWNIWSDWELQGGAPEKGPWSQLGWFESDCLSRAWMAGQGSFFNMMKIQFLGLLCPYYVHYCPFTQYRDNSFPLGIILLGL